MTELHPTARRIYGFIIRFGQMHVGNMPSRREIAEGCMLEESTHVRKHLLDLQAAGLIRIEDRKARWIEVVGARWLPPNNDAFAS